MSWVDVPVRIVKVDADSGSGYQSDIDHANTIFRLAKVRVKVVGIMDGRGTPSPDIRSEDDIKTLIAAFSSKSDNVITIIYVRHIYLMDGIARGLAFQPFGRSLGHTIFMSENRVESTLAHEVAHIVGLHHSDAHSVDDPLTQHDFRLTPHQARDIHSKADHLFQIHQSGGSHKPIVVLLVSPSAGSGSITSFTFTFSDNTPVASASVALMDTIPLSAGATQTYGFDVALGSGLGAVQLLCGPVFYQSVPEIRRYPLPGDSLLTVAAPRAFAIDETVSIVARIEAPQSCRVYAQLMSPSFDVTPGDPMQKSLSGGEIEFQWLIAPKRVGEHMLILWVEAQCDSSPFRGEIHTPITTGKHVNIPVSVMTELHLTALQQATLIGLSALLGFAVLVLNLFRRQRT